MPFVLVGLVDMLLVVAIAVEVLGVPLRYQAIILRGVFLEGSGLATPWPEATLLLVYGLSVLGLASLRFRKHLD